MRYSKTIIAYGLGVILLIIGLVSMTILELNFTKPKYKIYVGTKIYEADTFQVFGNTIHFRETGTKKNISIVGQYSLVYENVSQE